jgi:predicted acetyltransferase
MVDRARRAAAGLSPDRDAVPSTPLAKMTDMQLVRPAPEHLASYRAALERSWSPSTTDPGAGRVELERIDSDPAAFLAAKDDPHATGQPITLPDGSVVARLPWYQRWIWDDAFVGVINMRWQPGTATLPPHVLGHIGYSVTPWNRRRGYATAALRQLLPQLPALGLPHVEITTDVDNIASQKVITANGGVLIERFTKPAMYGTNKPALRWRIQLNP